MRIACAIATTATLLFSLMPAHADTIYPRRPCRVFVDTAYTQIPGQCGTVTGAYPRRLFLPAARRPWYYYDPY
jgi:hypothetical protein